VVAPLIATEEKKSTHKVEIVPVVLARHNNADSLSIIPVYGYTYVGRTSDWEGVKRAAYIPPDSLVDTRRPEFAFLADKAKDDGYARIKAMKLRGVVSFGLMVPVPDDTELGEDWAERLGVEHYEPPLAGEQKSRGVSLGGDEAGAPQVWAPKYDLDAFRRYHQLFKQGEPVVVTEKLDGANARYTYHDGQMHCGSRQRWLREYPDYSHVTVDFLKAQGCDEVKANAIIDKLVGKVGKRNMWWQILRDNPGIEAFCRDNPDAVLYGEIFGNVNCIKYGLVQDRFAAFDIMLAGEWMSHAFLRAMAESYVFSTVPMLNRESISEIFPRPIEPIPYDFDAICELAEGKTQVPGAKAGTIREGVVVSPIEERSDPHLGRVKLKVVSAAYLEKHR
jgi:RNA ligase (TIGR02306 family)